MHLTIATDILVEREPAPDALREAAARAFGVPASGVAVGRLRETPIGSGFEVVMQRQPEDMPRDFPVWYGLTLADRLLDRADDALNHVMRQLGLVALSDAGEQDAMTLHLPDGSGLLVRLPQGDDDSFHLPPELQHTVSVARRHAAYRDIEPGASSRAIAS